MRLFGGQGCGKSVWDSLGPHFHTPEEALAKIFGRLMELVFAVLARPPKRDAMPGG